MITAIDKYSALVLIDFQYNIVQIDTVHPVYEVLAKAASLVQTFRDRKLPIVYVNVDAAGAAWTYARKDTGRVRPAGTPISTQANAMQDPTAIVPQVIPTPNDIYITKKNWNAFCNTTLHEELQKRFVTNIVLAGIATSIGVEGTARAASELGYNITFAIDAMTDRSVAGHRHSRKEIFPRLGEVGNAEDIIRQLQYIAVNV